MAKIGKKIFAFWPAGMCPALRGARLRYRLPNHNFNIIIKLYP